MKVDHKNRAGLKHAQLEANRHEPTEQNVIQFETNRGFSEESSLEEYKKTR